jgi:23S rRNA pseudouridine1911/1915/1917 synthase
MEEREFTVSAELAGERLDVAACRLWSELTRARVKKLLADGHITVNGERRKANHRVRTGDTIHFLLPPLRETGLTPEAISLDVLYEDDHLLVINKPKGMVVHPAAGHSGGTMVNALLHHCGRLSGISGEARPGIVHRLDKDTSGVLVAAKNDAAHLALSRQFREHTITREYVAIVHGAPAREQGTVEGAIARHRTDRKKMAIAPPGKGRAAVTHFRILEEFRDYTYLALRLETGRTHQIRVHLSALGHPVAGDPVYGPKRPGFKFAGQALHARLLRFTHPADGREMQFEAPPPEDFRQLLEHLRRQQEEGCNVPKTDNGRGGHAPRPDQDSP